MRKLRLEPAGLTLVMALALPAAPARAEEIVDGIAAQVGSEIVLVSEILRLSAPMEKKLLEAGGSESDVAMLREDLLDRLIERSLIEQVVRRAELEASDSEVAEAIEKIAEEHGLSLEELAQTVEAQGMSIDDYRERIRGEIQRARVLSAMVTSRVRVEEDEIKRLYRKRYGDQPRGGRQVHARHILVRFGDGDGPGEREACEAVREARRRIQAGEDFQEVASEITEVNPRWGGDLGWLHEDNLAGWMAEPLAALSDGELSRVVETPFGCNLLQLVERRDYEPVTYEAARAELHDELFQERTEEKYSEWIEELRARTYIERKAVLTEAVVSVGEVSSSAPAEGAEPDDR